LIEVLAGLIILGTLLVSVSIARARFLNQWAEAEHRIQAVKGTDKLLAVWLTGAPQMVPVASEGALPDAPGFVWRTHLLRDPGVQTLDAGIVRVEVFDTMRGKTAREPILSLDFLLHQLPPRISPITPQ
jgi:hypothetical protein